MTRRRRRVSGMLAEQADRRGGNELGAVGANARLVPNTRHFEPIQFLFDAMKGVVADFIL